MHFVLDYKGPPSRPWSVWCPPFYDAVFYLEHGMVFLVFHREYGNLSHCLVMVICRARPMCALKRMGEGSLGLIVNILPSSKI